MSEETKKLSEQDMLKLDLFNEVKLRKKLEQELTQERIERKKLEIEFMVSSYTNHLNNDSKFKELETWFQKLKIDYDLKEGFNLNRETGEITNKNTNVEK